jgi:transcription elongation factor GreB
LSKAFTRESDDSEGDDLLSYRPQLPPGARNYITPKGAAKLKQRLEGLLEKKQTAELSEADVKKLDGAIRNLKLRLDSVVIVEAPSDPDKIAVGAFVQVRRGDGEDNTYQIVGVDESNPEHGAISWISPLAKALVSKKAGEKVPFRSPAGNDELHVLKVWYE